MFESRPALACTARSITLIGVLVNGFLIVFKFLTGIFGQSQALIADAAHSFSDLFTDLVVLVGLRIGRKAADENHHFGHARIGTLASAIVGLALLATALFLGLKATFNIYHHTDNYPTGLALVGAGVSIVLKEVLYHCTVHTGRRIKNQLIVANAWHHRSDAFSSVAVLLGVAGAWLKPSWHVLDAYATLLVSFFIIKVGLDIFKKALNEFTDMSPEPEVINKIKNCAGCVNGVISIHDLRVRSSGGLYQMETHIVVDGRLTVSEGHRIAKAVESCLEEEIDSLDRVIIHVDPQIEENE